MRRWLPAAQGLAGISSCRTARPGEGGPRGAGRLDWPTTIRAMCRTGLSPCFPRQPEAGLPASGPSRTFGPRGGLRAHKFATSTAGAPLVITGVERRHSGDVAPPARFRKIRALKAELQQSQTPERKYVFLRALIGQYREGQQLIPNAKSHADRYQRELMGLPRCSIAHAWTPAQKNRCQETVQEEAGARCLRLFASSSNGILAHAQLSF